MEAEPNETTNTYEYVHDFEWTLEMEEEAKKILEENSEITQDETTDIQSRNWEKLYKFNKTNFFKDRHYILREFAELKNDERVNKILI
jgi:DNA-directed RNA polymerase subunit F